MEIRKTCLITIFLGISATFCKAQSNALLYKTFIDNKILSSKYYGEQSKEVWFTGSNGLKVRTKFTGHQVVVTAFKGNKGEDLMVFDPPEPLLVQVTEYDINKDGNKEIIVAYRNEGDNLKFGVYSSSNFKFWGEGEGSDLIRFHNNKIQVLYGHEGWAGYTEYWELKAGKLINTSSVD